MCLCFLTSETSTGSLEGWGWGSSERQHSSQGCWLAPAVPQDLTGAAVCNAHRCELGFLTTWLGSKGKN